MRRLSQLVRRLLAARATQEAGYAAVMVSVLLPTVFLGLAAVALDTARWYLEMERVQKAADAASLAGVPYMPQDLASARTLALQVAARNGYDDAAPDIVVDVAQGERESQLKVTISSQITNQFGTFIGVNRATIVRSAVADFNGPAPMGSPCNVFGTEPTSGSAAAAVPVGSAIGAIRPSNCPQDPMMWANIEGPETGKVQGDRYQTEKCESSGVDGCSSGKVNEEYEDEGYFWVVRVEPEAVNQPISLQLYDPAFVLTGQFCTDKGLPDHKDLRDDMNPYAPTDARARYAQVDSTGYPSLTVPFCTGDSFPGSSSKKEMTTSFILRQQHDSLDPMAASVQSSTTGAPCVKQYGALTKPPKDKELDVLESDYIEDLARVYHNWTELCTFTPTRSGYYYLQVRTNKSYSFAKDALIRNVPAGSVASVADAAPDSSLAGAGSNAFGVRAVVTPGKERYVAVSGWERMPIYANSTAAATTFNLIRVLPGAAGHFITFDFFDAGDAAGEATVQVLLPSDARSTGGGPLLTPFPAPGCTTKGGSAGAGQTLVNCTATLTRSGGVSRNNGKVQTMNIPIPTDYTCDTSLLTNCWYRVKVSFASGEVHDVTTWDAELAGDPVRLVD